MIQTTRLILEDLRADHASELFEDLCSSDLYTFIPVDPPSTISALLTVFERRVASRPLDRQEIWLNWVGRRKDTGRAIGLFEITIAPGRFAKLAYTVFKDQWRLGFGKEGCVAAMRYTFGNYNIDKIIAEVDTRNVASLKLLESIGFSFLETVVGADFFKGTQSDEIIFCFPFSRKDRLQDSLQLS